MGFSFAAHTLCKSHGSSQCCNHHHTYTSIGNTWADNNEIYYKDKIHCAPLADRIEVLDYEEPPDALSDTSEEYALVQDALPVGRVQKVHSTLKREFKPGKINLSRNYLLLSPLV